MVHWCAAVSLAAVLAEYIAMTLFVMIGCGSAMAVANTPGWTLQVSLAFGLAITALAYAIGHYSGGHINCAVTFGLVLVGACGVVQGLANFVAQMLGSLTGAGLLCLMFRKANDRTGSIASNMLQWPDPPGERVEWYNAFVAEIFGTYLLVFVVIQTAVNPKSFPNRVMACLAIGFAVFLAHSVLIPIDGCAINPTRNFGPAVVATSRYANTDDSHERSLDNRIWNDMWIFWVGPLIGAALAALTYHFLNPIDEYANMKADGAEELIEEDDE